MGVLITVIVLCVLIFVGAIAMYNGLVSLRREADNALSQIDVQLKRRYELIPNLVETVKGYMAHEKDTLERVIQARNGALSANTIGERTAAESQVNRALSGIFALAESYPELKANENMQTLQEELASTENKVAFARQYYNDIVTRYNTQRETFPSSIIASMGNFKQKELFELDEPEARKAIRVKF